MVEEEEEEAVVEVEWRWKKGHGWLWGAIMVRQRLNASKDDWTVCLSNTRTYGRTVEQTHAGRNGQTEVKWML